MTPAPAEDAGSFRDRDGRVYRQGDRIFRGLSDQALERFRELRETGFFREFTRSGELIESEETASPRPLPEHSRWAGWLEHRPVPFVNYPYEWTFGMLRDAADLQLRLLEAALGEGWTLKDATPYNVQFVGGKPVFIDLPSFEPARDQPWAGYRQFCQMYLFPLMLQAYRGIDFQPFLRASLDGISVSRMASLTSLRDRFRAGVLTHVWLQALLERRYGGTHRDVRSELGSAGFSRDLVLANVRRLRRLVDRLEWRAAGSEWADYASQHNYSAADAEAKRRFVDTAVQASGAQSAWDLGCNTGDFSRIAARHCPLVLAMDADHLAVERLYRETGTQPGLPILPMVQNIADPSPNWGWNLAERRALAQRGRPGVTLCLALAHHIVIGANVPLRHLVEWLADLGGDLVIEFVGRDDDKVQTLLRNRVDQYDDYHLPVFEELLARHYRTVDRLELSEGRRVLFHGEPLRSTA